MSKRIVDSSTPNEHPRHPISSLLMMQMAAIQAAGANAAVELRGFGLHDLADSLTAEIEKIRIIHTAADRRTRNAVRPMDEQEDDDA